MKQTAVEWLEEQMLTWGDKPRWMRDNIVEQAKEMEKQQIKNAYDYGFVDGGAMVVGDKPTFKNEEQYYNETFKSDGLVQNSL